VISFGKIKIKIYIPRKNGKIRKPHLSYCRCYFTNDIPPYKDIGIVYEFYIGWFLLNIDYYY
jgi:hypothetical protein